MRIAITRTLALQLAVGTLLLAAPALAQDDADLFGASGVPPNVLLSFDTSGSMRAWVPPSFADQAEVDAGCSATEYRIDKDFDGFVETGTYTCEGAQGGTAKLGYVPVTECTRTRNIWVDPIAECDAKSPDTSAPAVKYSGWQWDWYFSAAGDDHYIGNVNNTSTDKNMVDATRNYYDGYSGLYFPMHHMSRMTVNKRVARELMFRVNSDCALGTGATCTQFTDKVRFGLGRFMESKYGGYVGVGIDDYSSNRTLMNNHLFGMYNRGNTPVSESLFRIYTYFMSRNTSNLPKGKDNSTNFPVYQYKKVDSSDWNGYARPRKSSPTASDVAPQPDITEPCQKNFVIVFADGDSSRDDFSETGTDAEGFDDFESKLIGDYYVPGDEVEEYGSKGSTRYLDDIAYFMNTKDFAPNVAGDQTIDVYTVGLNLDVGSNSATVMKNAATRGGGQNYVVGDSDELIDSLSDAFKDIITKSEKTFATVSVPASRTSEGDSFYSTYFSPDRDDPLWEGHLKAFEFSAAGDLLDASGYCLISTTANDPPPCNTAGSLRNDAPGFWDAADEVPAPGLRNLYFGEGAATLFEQPPNWDDITVTAADLNLVAGDRGSLPYSASADLDELADWIVNYLSGCALGTNCTTRGTVLGEIFHSNPVVVGSPNSPVNEQAYQTFANDNRERDRVIYAGENDGFLHGFHAGDWQTDDGGSPPVPLNPPRHDDGTGTELFGFMPSKIRQTVKALPISAGIPHPYYSVDGPIAVADAWLYRDFTASGNPVAPSFALVDKTAAQWRTILVGGLRQGGTGYYALDVTNPGASDYPGYLWEFPCDSDDCVSASNPDTDDSNVRLHLGETWSEPVITRVRVASDTGTVHERSVAIFGGGYHEDGDPNHTGYDWDNLTAGVQGRAIFIVDITTGELLAWKYFSPTVVEIPVGSGPQIGFPEMRYAFPSAPAVYDLDFDGFADVIFIGDLGGNMWKWVVTDVGDDPINNSTTNDNIAQPNWPFRLFFRGSASTEPPANHASPQVDPGSTHFQSFFNPPTGVLKDGKLVLAFGAGERADPTYFENDGSTANNNHFYVIVDDDALEQTSPAPDPLTDNFDEGDLADNSTLNSISCAALQSGYQGYYLTGRDAEKFATGSTIFLGDVITTSFIPDDPNLSVCDASGTGYIYRFGILCGDGAFTSNPGGDDEERRTAIGEGLPTRPRVSVGGINSGGGSGGCESKVTVVTSDGAISNDCPGPLPSSGIQLRSWRER